MPVPCCRHEPKPAGTPRSTKSWPLTSGNTPPAGGRWRPTCLRRGSGTCDAPSPVPVRITRFRSRPEAIMFTDALGHLSPSAAYAMVALVVLAESILLVGAFVPTLTLLLTAGVLARAGHISLPV